MTQVVDAHARLRLHALHSFDLLDHDDVPDLRPTVLLAAQLAGASTVLVNLVDDEDLWSVHALDGPVPPTPLSDALCAVTVATGLSQHTADASADPRFAGNPYVDGRAGHVRRYASAPLRTGDGVVIGTLCVMDEEPGALTTDQLGALGLLADQVVALLSARRLSRDLQRAVEDLDRLAHVDALTGLVNRTAALRALERMCETGGWALLFVDVDDFKAVNDLAGHGGGDAALTEIARRLQAALRPHDLLARWAGDEFVVLLAGVDSDAGVEVVVQRLAESVGRPYHLDELDLLLSVSAGGCVIRAGDAPEHVLREADLAMYARKRRRRAPHQLPTGEPAG